MKTKNEKLKVCYLLCYRAPNYTRTAALVTALETLQDVDLVVVKNRHTGLLRYPEVLLRLMKLRLSYRPDVFILGFRGQEVFGLFYPFMKGSNIIFDEFINHHDWIVQEHNKFGRLNRYVVEALDRYMRWSVRRCAYVLEDTSAHVRLGSRLYRFPEEKFVAVPVGADETVFTLSKPADVEQQKFEVFFYGNMLPLHGLSTILESIKLFAASGISEKVHFTLVGGKGDPKMIAAIKSFIRSSGIASQITYIPWVDYEKLPAYIAEADVCLGGPFGGTGQARRVITGKTYQFLAMAKPTIIGQPEFETPFEDRENCLIVEQNNPQALKDAMLWCYEHRSRLNSIGQAARKLFESDFSNRTIAAQLEKILRATVSG